MADGGYRDNSSVRIGVDFGDGTTVIAAAGPGLPYHTLEFPEISREYPAGAGGAPVHGIPSLVRYEGGRAVQSGDGVASAGLTDDPSTARWMCHCLCTGNPARIPAGGGCTAGYGDAAAAFLIPLLSRALGRYPGAGLVFTLPPGPSAAYTEFLRQAARAAGAASCSFAGMYQAVAAGYGYDPSDGEPFAVVTVTETGTGAAILAADDRAAGPEGGGLKVLAHAAGTSGCRALDSGIARDLLGKFRLLESDPRAVRLAPRLRYEALLLREQIPAAGTREVRLTDTVSGKTFTAAWTGTDLDRVLAARETIPSLAACIARACSALRAAGGDGRRVRAVLLAGTGCALPAVQAAVRSGFPDAAVFADHPVDAAARGAAVSAAPAPAQDRITRSYALRYWDSAMQEHHYRLLVHSGTRYPSAGQVARVVISAAYDGQDLLGIPLYEIGGGDAPPLLELVPEIGGGVRLAGPLQDSNGNGGAVHANERSPTLLVASPPARRGEPRFECTFSLDPDRNLCLSARDLVTGALVKVNAPVHRLK